MAAAVALVGASPELAALRQLLGAEVALEVRRTTADHIEQAVGPKGMAVLEKPYRVEDLLRRLHDELA